MTSLRFGTDGVRGRVNGTLPAEDAWALGLAHGYHLREEAKSGERPRVVVGRDTRVSGDALFGLYSAGLMCQGVNVYDLGVIPTPGVAFMARARHFNGAAMISASHNPVPDNGLKLFDETGRKLSDDAAHRLEELAHQADRLSRVDGVAIGRLVDDRKSQRLYHQFLLSRMEGPLYGMTIVLDCAYGAAVGHAGDVFRAAGAKVVTLANQCDGERINVACGSTNLSALSQAVERERADLGLAFDGDADRCLAVTESGRALSGDQMMVVIARYLKDRARLPKHAVVLTVMSNLGAEIALTDAGIEVKRTAVGDRHVFEEMERTGTALGGEQSGHILLLDRHWSGDGILAGLVFAGIARQYQVKVSDLVADIKELPQHLVNVAGVDRNRLTSDPTVLAAIEQARQQLGPSGRLLVRPSGTEPLVRLMAEGPEEKRIVEVLGTLRAVVEQELALG